MKIPGRRTIEKYWYRLSQRGIILMYHRVVDLKSDPWKLCVSPENFKEQMSILKKWGRPVRMCEMGENLRDFPLGKKEIVVSFDDGYADNFHNARPILEQYSIPAIFYIVSGSDNKAEEFWWDELERDILAPKILPSKFDITIGGARYYWRVQPEDQKDQCYDIDEIYRIPGNDDLLSRGRLYFALWRILSELSFSDKKEILRPIGQWAQAQPMPRLSHLRMAKEDLLSLARNPLFELGAHTVSHPLLSKLPSQDQHTEISRSKFDLEELIGQPVESFSYPHGDYTNETVEIVKRSKFKNACTVVEEYVRWKADPFLLPRFMVLDWDAEQFERKLREWL